MIPDEVDRQRALDDLDLVDAPAEPALDELVALAARLLDVPISAVNLIDGETQWTMAGVGLDHGTRMPRATSFCAHAIASPHAPLVVPDTRADGRFDDNPLTLDGMGSYAGVPLLSPSGHGVGTLCVADRHPRVFGPEQLESLEVLARAVSAHVMLRRENRRLEDLSATDPLTGVANRRALGEHLVRELLRASRSGQPLSVLMLDLDHFKAFNDTHGHPAGDRLLHDACAAWSDQLRGTDVLARYGGEEFLVVAPSSDAAGAQELADRLRAAVPGDVSCSIGVAQWSPGEGLDDLVARADEALYDAKRAGRDTVIVAV